MSRGCVDCLKMKERERKKRKAKAEEKVILLHKNLWGTNTRNNQQTLPKAGPRIHCLSFSMSTMTTVTLSPLSFRTASLASLLQAASYRSSSVLFLSPSAVIVSSCNKDINTVSYEEHYNLRLAHNKLGTATFLSFFVFWV